MSREVRRVPANWEHPRNERGIYIPLFDIDFEAAAARWDAAKVRWDAGERPEYCRYVDRDTPFEEWAGPRPVAGEYMPRWPEAERTHLQMYETTSEGTPISPVMVSVEELARWLADNEASAFAGQTATYEQWLIMIKLESSVSMVSVGNEILSGVEASAFAGQTATYEQGLDVTGIDAGELLAALYNNSQPLGLGWLHARGGIMTAGEARALIADGGKRAKLERAGFTVIDGGMEWSVDYVHGHPIKVGVRDGRLYGERLYDRDNGAGECARIVGELRGRRK